MKPITVKVLQKRIRTAIGHLSAIENLCMSYEDKTALRDIYKKQIAQANAIIDTHNARNIKVQDPNIL